MPPGDATIEGMATHIVVIEDDSGIGSSLARTLEGQGYQVAWRTTAQDGMAAVQAALEVAGVQLEEAGARRDSEGGP